MSSPNSSAAAESPDPDPAPPFFNTTFSTHRVSPLHIGEESLSSEARLEAVSSRLRDVLVGGAVRGVEIRHGRDEQAFSRTGALETVQLDWVTLDSVLGITRDGNPPSGQRRPVSRDLGIESVDQEDAWPQRQVLAANISGRRALHISLTYEEGQCSGILLPPLSGEEFNLESEGRNLFTLGPEKGETSGKAATQERFLHLPLLLLRMPPALKAVVIDFLSTTFDCRVSPLHLGTRTLVQCWESWAKLTGPPSRGTMAKAMVLTLNFYIPSGESILDQRAGDENTNEQSLGVKAIDVIIPASDLSKFRDVGKRLNTQSPVGLSVFGNKQTPGWEESPAKRRKLAGRLHEEGWGWRKGGDKEAADGVPLDQPFTEALGAYVNQHLALDLFHPSVRITKIACSGFVLTDGRLKVLSPGVRGDEADITGLSQYKRAAWELLVNLVNKANGRDVL